MSKLAERQLQAAREIVAHIAERLEANISLELWNGEVLPLGPKATGDMRLVISSPGAVRRLLLKPNFITLYELFGFGDIGIEGGTPMQAAERWDHMKALSLPKQSTRPLSQKGCGPFLFGGDAPKAESDEAKKLGWSAPVAQRLALRAMTSRSSVSTTSHRTISSVSSSTRRWFIRRPISRPAKLRSMTRRRPSSTASAKSCGFNLGEHFLDIGLRPGALSSATPRATMASRRMA